MPQLLLKLLTGMLFASALAAYAITWKAIFRLIGEARQIGSEVRFNRFWWLPAWRVHKTAYPDSSTRRQIVVSFAMTFLLMIVAMGCLAYLTLQVKQS